jgi:hypothetical protein
MKRVTVVYYTGNSEDAGFEQKIQEQLILSMHDCDCDLISVSQKPCTVGKNICVGEVGHSDLNAIRQLSIGIEEAKTEFVIPAESDCLYPPEYFKFIPSDEKTWYRYNNVWMMCSWKSKLMAWDFRKKFFSECAQILGRDFWLERIKIALDGFPQWSNEYKPIRVLREKWVNTEEWNGILPVVNIKTGNGLRKTTRVTGGESKELPYWGVAEDLRKELFG